MAKRFRCELISWTRFYTLTRRLAFSILRQGFKPHLVIAIGRGGYVPARVLCDFLKIEALTAIKIEHWSMGAVKQEAAHLRFPLNVDISEKRVLVVDDVTDTGDTLIEAVRYLEAQRPSELKTAVVQHKIGSKFIPDYFAHRIVKWRWIIYPWALVEDVTGFIEQMRPLPATMDEAAKRLYQDYELQLPGQLLKDIWILSQGRCP